MLNRRQFLQNSIVSTAGTFAAASFDNVLAAPDTEEVLTTEGIGDAKTPRFYRVNIGSAPGRMHEPTAGTDGNIWTSPLDGNLWQYDTKSGKTHIHDLQKLTGRKWSEIHLWPIASGQQVYLCTPSLAKLHIWNREVNRVTSHDFPHAKPSVYGGYICQSSPYLYLYDTKHSSVLKWNTEAMTGQNFPCPYQLSNTLYMTFIDHDRQEYWGSTWNGNDIVRFDIEREKWTGHFKCPEKGATPTAGGKVFGNKLFVSDHLNGRIFPLDADSGEWGQPIPVPGYGKWFGYVSGGWHFRGKLYLCHSTWTGGNNSLDGEPHHFIGTWSVFDPKSSAFSQLAMPTRADEERQYLMSDYCAVSGDDLFILAVNQKPPNTVIVLQSRNVA